MVKTSQEFAIKINTFNSLSLLEKIELRNRFIQIYDRNHLVDYL